MRAGSFGASLLEKGSVTRTGSPDNMLPDLRKFWTVTDLVDLETLTKGGGISIFKLSRGRDLGLRTCAETEHPALRFFM